MIEFHGCLAFLRQQIYFSTQLLISIDDMMTLTDTVFTTYIIGDRQPQGVEKKK